MPRAGDDAIRSLNGSSPEMRRKPPVFHLRRVSRTRPSHGLRNRPHGSQHDLGITETPGNSSLAFLGRSPPRSVYTRRMISPRFSNPEAMNGSYTRWDTSGFVAMNTWAP